MSRLPNPVPFPPLAPNRQLNQNGNNRFALPVAYVNRSLSRYGDLNEEEVHEAAGGFSQLKGNHHISSVWAALDQGAGLPIPFFRPNVGAGNEKEDLSRIINKDTDITNNHSHYSLLGGVCCCLSCFIPFYPCCCQMRLIEEGKYGFSRTDGLYRIHFPGRFWLSSPLQHFLDTVNVGQDQIIVGPITIVRVPQGKLGLAFNNSIPEVLLPGVHVRTSAAFQYSKDASIDEEIITHGPIKFVTVKSGQVRVCYDAGIVTILHEGRYAINSGPFRVANTINTQQQNMRFSKHPVLLDGGIGLLVEGLLTFKVVDVEKLIKELGESDLARCIEDVTKAEISRVFAGIHLEQISSATNNAALNPSSSNKRPVPSLPSLLGESKDSLVDSSSSPSLLSSSPTVVAPLLPYSTDGKEEGMSELEERSRICHHIIKYIRPIVEPWGVRILNFQLESTAIADVRYAAEYEQASLRMAKAKANLRAVDCENDILIRQSLAKAKATVIEAEGEKIQIITRAKGSAEARKLEAASRNEAAISMPSQFARDFALSGLQVEFARKLKATSLTILPESIVGAPLVGQAMLAKQE